MNSVYVIARNASARPTAMHELPDYQASRTGCGADVSGWSRCFVPETVALGALRPMLCGNCARRKS